MPSGLNIVWFKRDLRIADHRPLTHAASAGTVLPLFIAEPEIWAAPDMAARHWDFAAECLADLRTDLSALGQPLVIRVGEAVEILERFRRARGVAALWSHEETGNASTYDRDRRVAAWCRAHSIPWHEFPQNGVIRKLRSRDGWARRWEARMAEAKVAPPALLEPVCGEVGVLPSARDLCTDRTPCPQRQTGGRAAALERLGSFLEDRGRTYRRAMSSPLAGAHACSRLSPHLAWGTVSMREVAHAVRSRQIALRTQGEDRDYRASLASFSGRLHWHCHFMQKLEDAPDIEHRNIHPAYDGMRPPPDPGGSSSLLSAWESGETGLPFVDACMRSLRATGWLNFRMRAMVMSVASYQLWLDWRAPGLHLARLFTDYEPGIHWPQVQMQSGTTGINIVRIYNPVKQGYDQDPAGAFVRRWVPELAAVPDPFIHEPWRWVGASDILGRTYPIPIVDHAQAARFARQRIWSVRRGEAFRDQANAIQDKHGSRRSGLSQQSQRRVRARRSAGAQLPLPLALSADDPS